MIGVGTSAGGIVTPGGKVMAGDNVPSLGGSVTPGGSVTAGDNVPVGGGIVTIGVGAGVVGTYKGNKTRKIKNEQTNQKKKVTEVYVSVYNIKKEEQH